MRRECTAINVEKMPDYAGIGRTEETILLF